MRTCIKMYGISTSFFQPKLHNTYFSKFFTYRTRATISRSWFETLFRPAFIWQILLEKKNSAGCLLKTKWLMMHFRGTQIVCQITLNVQFFHCLNKSSNESRSNYTITKTRSLMQVCFPPFIYPLLRCSKIKPAEKIQFRKLNFHILWCEGHTFKFINLTQLLRLTK